MSTICVALVVRNAAEYVGVCLRSVLAQQCNIGYWIAVDLGSDDDTLLTITNIFEPNGIHGHIVCEPGRTAEEILSAALEAARPHADYTWVIDPTNVIVGYMTLPEKLTADVYSLQYVSDNQKTQSLAIFSNAIDWHYVGTPEYPVCSKEQYENVSVEGYYYHGDNPRETVRLRRDSTALLGGPIAVVVVLTVFSCCLLTATCVAIYKFVKA